VESLDALAVLWIAIAFILGMVVRHFGLPPLIGYLTAGFLLRAGGQEGGEWLNQAAHLGVLLLLFTVGLKLRLRSLMQPQVWGGGLLHLMISGLTLGPLLHYLAGLNWPMALIVGVSLGFSSTVLAAKVLEQKRELRAFHGRVTIGILIFQDLAAVALLGVSEGAAPSPLLLILLGLPALRWLMMRLLSATGHDELLILYGLLLALLSGWGFAAMGLSAELGALVAGALLAAHPRAVEMSVALGALKEAFLVAFFLQIGLAGWPDLKAFGFALLLAALLPFKAALFFFVLIRFRLRARSAFITSLALASYSEFALIVAHSLAGNGALSPQWLALLAIAVALSFIFAAPLHRISHILYERYQPRLQLFELAKRHPDEQPVSLGKAGIMVFGMGRTGKAAYDFLSRRGERVVGLDSDPGKVETHRQHGRRVLYADAEDAGFWHTVKMDDIKAVILAMPDLEAKLIATTHLRRRGFTGLIGTTSYFADEAQSAATAGADVTLLSFDEAGAGLAEHVWRALYDEGAEADKAD